MNPPLYLTLDEFEFEGKVVLHTYVPVGTTVYRHAGRIFDRNNEADIDITNSADLVYHLYARKQDSFYVNKVFPEYTIDDLRPELMDRARKCALNGHPWKVMSNEEILRTSKLILNDRESGKEGLTLASILLFGPDQLIYTVLPQHRTDALVRVYNTDRYDDRDIIETNLLESYDRLIEFGNKHLNDLFVLDGTSRVSARDSILREVVVNSLCHRDFSSKYYSSMVIYKDRLETTNGNVAHSYGTLELDTFQPFSKNPPIADVFRAMGWADELGSGMRNTFKYTGLYSGGMPVFKEGDLFKTIIPLSDAATGLKVGGKGHEKGDKIGDKKRDKKGERKNWELLYSKRKTEVLSLRKH